MTSAEPQFSTWVTVRMGKELLATPSIDPWDEAFRRVESYLHACRVSPRIRLTEVAIGIVDEARRRAADGSGQHPVALAMEVLKQRMATTFRAAFAEQPEREDLVRARGRLGLMMTGAPEQWAGFLQRAQPCSPELAHDLAEQPLQAGPELRLSKMPPAKIEFGFVDDDEELAPAGRWVPVPALAVSVVALGLMGAAWAATH
jgi:hypothetical protein